MRISQEVHFRHALSALSCVFLLTVLLAFPVQAESTAQPGPAADSTAKALGVAKSNAPLNISSDRLEVDQKDKTILFEGHVVVVQEDMTITGKRMKVFQVTDAKGAGSTSSEMANKIDRIEIEGDVRISQQDKVATSDKAIYYHREQKIVLIGSPQVTQGQDSVKGRLITLYLAEDRSVVEGGEATPVQAVIHPDKENGPGRPKTK